MAEGTYVHAGDRLIRFDTSALEQDLVRENAARKAAEVEQLRAIDDFKVDQLRQASEFDSATVRADSAEQTLANQIDGQGRMVDYSVLQGQMTSEIGNLLLFTTFNPATFFKIGRASCRERV